MQKDIPGFPGYQIDEEGNVYSFRKRGPGTKLNDFAIKLKFTHDKDGYLKTYLCRDNKLVNIRVHRLLMMVFRPNKNHENLLVRHLDGNLHNNKLENLAWGTAKDNSQDRYVYGRPQTGAKNPNASISETKAMFFKKAMALGIKRKDLMKTFGVSWNILNQIYHGYKWKHLELPIPYKRLCKRI